MTPYRYSSQVPASTHFKVEVDGEPIHVLDTKTAALACFECPGGAEVRVTPLEPCPSGSIHPISRGLKGVHQNGSLVFRLNHPENLTVQFPGQRLLFLHISPEECGKPDPDDPDVLFFGAGRIHEAGKIELRSGQTLYLEGGAVVRGCIRAYDAEGITICGRGILDGSYYGERNERQCSILLGRCDSFEIRDLAMIHPSMWMIVPTHCDGGHIHNVQQIGERLGTDGIDIVGSRNILIENCQQQNEDDCVVIKSLLRYEGPAEGDGASVDGRFDVENIRVRRCIFENTQGVVMEIGHELITDSIRNIQFTDIDVLHSHRGGSIMGIHNCDYATVSDVLFEDLRIEHYWDKLIDLRVMDSEYAKNGGTGQVRDITIRNIEVTHLSYNTGYTISLIGGFDEDHTVERVAIENLSLNGRRLTTLQELNLFTRFASGIAIS
jgi:hypothetical protein